jgi:hypothetical protein
MLMSRKTHVVAVGDVRADYPEREKPRLTLEQHTRITELARRMELSEEEVIQRLVAAAQPSIDRVVDAALRLMALQLEAGDSASH